MKTLFENGVTLERTPVEMGRDAEIANKIVFVGGQGGCGKSMLTPILAMIDKMEIQKYNYPLEHILTLHYLGKLTDDVANTMVRMLIDLDLYNLMMSREVNFRFTDLSSIFKNPHKIRYIRRLFMPGDEAVMPRIWKEKPILHILIHDLLMRSKPLVNALGEKATIVEMVRHPLYMVKQWMKNVEQFYSDSPSERDYPRDFSLRYKYKGRHLSWWAHGIEDLIVESSNMDRLIYAMKNHFVQSKKVFDSYTEEEKKRILIIPFEQFVLDPLPFLNRLADLLGSTLTPQVHRELKKQNIPRKMIAQGIALPVYKKYGWKPPAKDSDERKELNDRRDWLAREASAEALAVMDQMSAEYEETYMKEILSGLPR